MAKAKSNPKEAWPGASARSTEDVLRSYRDMREAVDSGAYRGATLAAYKLSLKNYAKELRLRGVKVPTSAEVATFYGKPKKNPGLASAWRGAKAAMLGTSPWKVGDRVHFKRGGEVGTVREVAKGYFGQPGSVLVAWPWDYSPPTWERDDDVVAAKSNPKKRNPAAWAQDKFGNFCAHAADGATYCIGRDASRTVLYWGVRVTPAGKHESPSLYRSRDYAKVVAFAVDHAARFHGGLA